MAIFNTPYRNHTAYMHECVLQEWYQEYLEWYDKYYSAPERSPLAFGNWLDFIGVKVL